ncbi:MAG: DUF2017 family protein [Acidimicrobiia bacterium]
MAQRIRRSRDGLVLTLYPAEVEVLRDLAGQLESLLDGGVPERGGDPTRDRLFPRAYLDPTEDAAETEWQVAVHEDLVRQKSAAVGALVDSLDTGTAGRKDTLQLTLPPEAVEQWVGALNDVRLALGVVLEVTEDEAELDPDDPRAPGLELYHWLTWLQGSLVEELLGAIGDEGEEGEDA